MLPFHPDDLKSFRKSYLGTRARVGRWRRHGDCHKSDMPNARLAIAAWAGQVSTVFDFAHRLILVDLGPSGETGRSEIALRAVTPALRASRLAQLGANVLICGAISRPLAQLVAAQGIEIVPFVRGAVDDVVEAHLAGRLREPRFLLPGFRPVTWWVPRGGRRFRGGR